MGEYHGVQKRDIVGAIANEVGLDPQHMGKIRMFKDHTFIDLPKDMPPEIFEALKSVWVQGHQMNISIDKGRPRPDGKGGKFRKKLWERRKEIWQRQRLQKEIQAPFPKLKPAKFKLLCRDPTNGITQHVQIFLGGHGGIMMSQCG